MRPKGYRKVHEVPKNAQTAQMHPKYLTGPKIASSDQSTESVQSENTASGRKVFQVLSLLVMLLQRARTWLLFFWPGKFIQKVLWEENTCEKGIWQTKFPKKEMWNSELLQGINDLRWGICFWHQTHNSHCTAHWTILIFFNSFLFFSGLKADLWKWN